VTVTRGATNGNVRGNNKARAKRRAWLVETYRADTDLVAARYDNGTERVHTPDPSPDAFLNTAGLVDFLWRSDARLADVLRTVDPPPRLVEVITLPACRCYRCGTLLSADTLTVDRIFPGILGGLYRTVLRDKREKVTNIRPACGPCNEKTGGALATRNKKRKG
jgi:hypothetical protein